MSASCRFHELRIQSRIESIYTIHIRSASRARLISIFVRCKLFSYLKININSHFTRCVRMPVDMRRQKHHSQSFIYCRHSTLESYDRHSTPEYDQGKEKKHELAENVSPPSSSLSLMLLLSSFYFLSLLYSVHTSYK